MKLALIFLAGLLVGGGILLTWAFFQLKSDASEVPASFAEASLARLPFDGEWFVFWGGGRAEQNAHHGVPAQHLALDLVMMSPGKEKSHKTLGRTNEDYWCWAQPVRAAHDGKVIMAVEGIPDNAPGQLNPQMVYGNSVMIQHESGFVSVYAHLKLGSVLKKLGDVVKAGDEIGLCGNSGNSSEPHLHFHVQSQAGFEQGVALRPVFKTLSVNGTLQQDYSPVKSDRIKP